MKTVWIWIFFLVGQTTLSDCRPGPGIEGGSAGRRGCVGQLSLLSKRFVSGTKRVSTSRTLNNQKFSYFLFLPELLLFIHTYKILFFRFRLLSLMMEKSGQYVKMNTGISFALIQ